MEKLLKTGKTKAIGISNFSRKEVETILEKGSVVPATHQLECHPWLQQKEFTEWQKEQGILIQHYSPFGNQNEIYDSGKTLGKLMVRFPPSSHFQALSHMINRMTQSSSKSARNIIKLVPMLHLLGESLKDTLFSPSPRPLHESSRIWKVTFNWTRKIWRRLQRLTRRRDSMILVKVLATTSLRIWMARRRNRRIFLDSPLLPWLLCIMPMSLVS